MALTHSLGLVLSGGGLCQFLLLPKGTLVIVGLCNKALSLTAHSPPATIAYFVEDERPGVKGPDL